MDELAKAGFKGAEHDSSERDPPPRCQPGTRSSVISKLCEWRDKPGRKHSLIWLQGPAGVGKSAIMQTLAEDLSSPSRPRSNPFFLQAQWTKWSYSCLSDACLPVGPSSSGVQGSYSKLIDLDPTILRKTLAQQFFKLIAEPFSAEGPCGDGSNPIGFWLMG